MTTQQSTQENDECPTNDFKEGQPSGTCWGNGHYRCKSCIHYRDDFSRLGQDFIDFAHTYQNGITMTFSHPTPNR